MYMSLYGRNMYLYVCTCHYMSVICIYMYAYVITCPEYVFISMHISLSARLDIKVMAGLVNLK